MTFLIRPIYGLVRYRLLTLPAFFYIVYAFLFLILYALLDTALIETVLTKINYGILKILPNFIGNSGFKRNPNSRHQMRVYAAF